MELEFKWDAEPALQENVLLWALDRNAARARLTRMDARYFDTADGLLAADKTALRLRQEGTESVCCLKLRGTNVRGGLHSHEEYECPAENLADGLHDLPGRGAPPELCARLLTLPLVETCRIRLLRYTVLLRGGGAEAELAFDRGEMLSGDKRAPLCEIELEHKSGPEADFLTLGSALVKAFGLKAQPLSKLARARAL